MAESESLAKKVLAGGVWTSVSSWLLKAATILSTIVILRYLSVAEYGVVQLVLSFFSFGILFNLSSFHDLFVAEVGIEKSSNMGRAKGLFWGYIKAEAVLGVVIWAVFFFGAPYFPGGTGNYARIISFMFLLSPAREAFQLLFNVELKFRELAIFSILEQISRLAVLIAGLAYTSARVEIVLLSTVISQVVAITFMIPAFSKVYGRYNEVHGERTSIISILLAHGKWGLFVSYISNFNKTLRIWLVQWLLGIEAVGLYGVASNLFSHTRSLLPISELSSPIIPQYASARDKLSILVNKAIKFSLLGYALLGIIGAAAFPFFIRILFPNFAASIPLYQLMLIGLLPHSITIILTPLFYTFRAQRSLFFAYTRRIILTALLLPVLIKFFGLYGIAIEFVFTAIIFVADRYIIARRLLPSLRFNFKSLASFDDYDRLLMKRLWPRKS